MRAARRVAAGAVLALLVLALSGCGAAGGAFEPAPFDETATSAGAEGDVAGAPAPDQAPAATSPPPAAQPGPAAVAHQPPPPRPPERPVAGQAQVEIARIGVQAPLIALGLNADRTMEVPTQRGVAGWYQYSPAPGAVGPSVIAGHVALSGRPDVFYRLVELEPGDEVAVRYDDGALVTFTVYEVEQHPKDAFPTERVYANTEAPELRLITCGGEFDQSRRSYRDNIIAFARISP